VWGWQGVLLVCLRYIMMMCVQAWCETLHNPVLVPFCYSLGLTASHSREAGFGCQYFELSAKCYCVQHLCMHFCVSFRARCDAARTMLAQASAVPRHMHSARHSAARPPFFTSQLKAEQ
jgi:hypothetical protein